ncbi:MAG: ribosome biogenesis GTPase Der [Verrucomicrobiota bacterium]
MTTSPSPPAESPAPAPRTVALVGRPNVGKSALFNRLARRDISLVFDRPGTTRDRISAECRWDGHRFELIDTGGIGLDEDANFTDAITREAEIALAAADDIVLVVDARDGLTPLDEAVAQKLRQAGRRVLVAANKIDEPAKQAHLADEFTALGFAEVFPLSAAHGRGLEPLMEALTRDWPRAAPGPAAAPRERPVRLTFCGRPNVGKSSLINALLRDDRAIVSDIPGTTRDAVDLELAWKGRTYTLIDTAGMRQRSRVRDELEAAMTGRSAHAINRAHVCVLVIDAPTGVSMQDKKIAGLIQKHYRPVLIAINKWDLAREAGDGGRGAQRAYAQAVLDDLFFLPDTPVIFVSAKEGNNLARLMNEVGAVWERSQAVYPTGPLNRLLHELIARRPPPRVKGKRFKLLYAVQQTDAKRDSGQAPTLILFCNDRQTLTPAYARFLEDQLRQTYDLRGCPLKLVLRDRTKPGTEKGRSRPPSKRKTDA